MKNKYEIKKFCEDGKWYVWKTGLVIPTSRGFETKAEAIQSKIKRFGIYENEVFDLI